MPEERFSSGPRGRRRPGGWRRRGAGLRKSETSIGPDLGDIDLDVAQLAGFQDAFAEDGGGAEAAIFEIKDFNGFRFRADYPSFWRADAFVIAEFGFRHLSGLGRRENLDGELRRRVAISVFFHQLRALEDGNIRLATCERICSDHQSVTSEKDVVLSFVELARQYSKDEPFQHAHVEVFSRRHLDDFAV